MTATFTPDRTATVRPADVIDDDTLRALSEPETAAALDVLPEIDARSGALALQRQSRQQLAALEPLPLPPDVTLAVEADGTRIFTPPSAATDRAVLWIHGGGLIAGEPQQDDTLCARLALEHGVVVRATPYRLAPQHPYPAGLEDCVAALERAIALHGSILLVGASAGGNLVIATAMVARDRRIAGVRGVVAFYPMLDDRAGRASMERFRATRTWHAACDVMAWDAYLPGTARTADVPAYAAPARATTDELRGLPPVFIDCGTLDGFLDEDLAFASQLAVADVAVELCITPRAWHASEAVAPDAPSSRRIAAVRRDAIARLLGSHAH